MWDWSNRGIPLAGGKTEPRVIDWTEEGVPFADDFDFRPDALRLAQSPATRKRRISAQQEEFCLAESDMCVMKEVHLDTHKTDLFNPWNRLTDNRREAAYLKGARNTKKTKRVWRYLRSIRSQFCEEADRKMKDFKLTRKRKNQRVDKRTRRGDTPYDGVEFIDEAPATNQFWDDWPDMSQIADQDETKRTEIVTRRRITKQVSREFRKSQNFKKFSHLFRKSESFDEFKRISQSLGVEQDPIYVAYKKQAQALGVFHVCD